MKKLNDGKILGILKDKLEELPKARAEYLKREINIILNNNYLKHFNLAYVIAEYLKKHNIYYYLGGNLASSYVAYELGIHNIDCYRFNIQPEICYGANCDSKFDLDFYIPERFKKQLFAYIDETIFDNKPIYVTSKQLDGTENIVDYKRVFIDGDIQGIGSIDVESLRDGRFSYICLNIVASKRLNQFLSLGVNDVFDLERIKEEEYSNNNEAVSFLSSVFKAKSRIKKDFIFNDRFTYKLVSIIKPRNFKDLIKIIGLCKWPYLWNNNQDALFENGSITVEDFIATRDDVYDCLIDGGFDRENALLCMECARKGLQLPNFVPTNIKRICEKAKYLWPRAHIIALLNTDMFLLFNSSIYEELEEMVYNKTKLESEAYIIEQYRKYACVGKDVKITKIDEWALNKVSAENNYDVHELRELLLKDHN